MAKSKTKKKTSLMLIISAVLLIAVSVMSLCMMSLPMSKSVTSTTILGSTTTVNNETANAFDYIKEWTEKDEDGNSKLSALKETIKKYEEGSIKNETLDKVNEANKQQVAIVECLIVVIVAAAVAMVLGLVALILAFVKKNGAGKVFGLLALLCVLAIFILSCIVYAFYNPVATALDGTIAGVTTTTTVVSAMALLIVSLIGFVASTVTLVLSRK
ncbi:MAG: hypothetical protein PUK83_04965 [Clostridia bacterium]|nr:hypothetical protein [Clostridia bacterium]MDY5264165.1 hypothetical protein [Eubacteriales bacterium]MDY5440117.1 hypothetical protein [Eubacteriales bacterium]